jgi:hypothetical protein
LIELNNILQLQIDFADAMGLSNTQISAYITTRRVFRQKKYIDRLKQLGLNFDWYLHGVWRSEKRPFAHAVF